MPNPPGRRTRLLSTLCALVAVSLLVTRAVLAGTGVDESGRPALNDLTPAAYLPIVVRNWPRPLFVGLHARWDGTGYIRTDEYFDVGWHSERDAVEMMDEDAIRIYNRNWYDPNPQGWDESTWNSFYSVSTGYFLSSSVPDDPDWKWGCPWILPYDWHFEDGQVGSIGGQPFQVSGPYSGYTAFGKRVQYWQFVNTTQFVYVDAGGDWQQRVHAGDIVLCYDAGHTRLLLHRDVLRTYYYQGERTPYTVQYIRNLTETNAFEYLGASGMASPGTEVVVDPTNEGTTAGQDREQAGPLGR